MLAFGPPPSFAPGLSSLRSEMIGTARPSLVPTYAMLDKGDGPFRLGVGARSAASGPTGECSPASEWIKADRPSPRGNRVANRSTSQYPVVVNLAGGAGGRLWGRFVNDAECLVPSQHLKDAHGKS